MHVLVIEDDGETAVQLTEALHRVGHQVDHTADGPAGLAQAQAGTYDVLVVDRMLPTLDGLGVIERLRAAGVRTPVLILSALNAVDQRVQGLRAGGDDYLCKPFAFDELLARLEALVRRSRDPATPIALEVADLEMDLLERTVTRAGQGIDLLPREFTILEYLMRHAGQVVTRTMLLENVWHYHFDPQTNVIDVHISRLRRKIDRDFPTPLLHTIRGTGYRLGGPAPGDA